MSLVSISAERNTALFSRLSDPDSFYVPVCPFPRAGSFLGDNCMSIWEKGLSNLSLSPIGIYHRYRMLLALCVTCDVLKRMVKQGPETFI